MRTISFTAPDFFDPVRHGSWPFGELRPAAYDLIMADPPWQFQLRSALGEEKSAQAQYQTMTIEDIATLPVADLAAQNCLLWLWGTAPMLPQQIDVMRAWGFRFVTSGVWVKQARRETPLPPGQQPKLAFGTGYVLRNAHEPFLIGAIGEPRCERNVRSVVMAAAREHSRKPEQAFEAAERMIPNARRCEVFSRQSRRGWEVWGNEVDKFDGQHVEDQHVEDQNGELVT